MTAPRVIFFCGERSGWGYSHIYPLLGDHSLDLVEVVLATSHRWQIFRRALSGQDLSLPLRVRLEAAVRRMAKRDPASKVMRACSARGVRVAFIEDVNCEVALERFRRLQPDWIFSAAYPQIFKTQLLTVAKVGAANSHPSLLPRCRGAHPVFWAIASGETQTGGTIHVMTEKLDAGDIIAQAEFPINPTDTYSQVYNQLDHVIPQIVTKFSQFIRTPGMKPAPQDAARVTYFRNDRAIHHALFWSCQTAADIHNLVRACDGSAYFWLRGRKIMVQEVAVLDAHPNLTNGIRVPPGTVIGIDHGHPVITSVKGCVALRRWRVCGCRSIKFNVGQMVCG